MIETSKTRYHASVRYLAEEEEVNKNTVSASNRRLQELGVVVPVECSRSPRHANVWTLRLPPSYVLYGENKLLLNTHTGEYMNNSYITLYLNVLKSDTSHGIWRRRGLGKAKGKAWMALLTRERWRVVELAERLDVSPPQVKRHLGDLAKHGLAQEVDRDE